jgi:hypothetical protein
MYVFRGYDQTPVIIRNGEDGGLMVTKNGYILQLHGEWHCQAFGRVVGLDAGLTHAAGRTQHVLGERSIDFTRPVPTSSLHRGAHELTLEHHHDEVWYLSIIVNTFVESTDRELSADTPEKCDGSLHIAAIVPDAGIDGVCSSTPPRGTLPDAFGVVPESAGYLLALFRAL